jgi:hypothetical protein
MHAGESRISATVCSKPFVGFLPHLVILEIGLRRTPWSKHIAKKARRVSRMLREDTNKKTGAHEIDRKRQTDETTANAGYKSGRPSNSEPLRLNQCQFVDITCTSSLMVNIVVLSCSQLILLLAL